MVAEFYADGIACTQLGDAVVGYIPMVRVRVDTVKFGTSNLQLSQQILSVFLASITDSHLGLNGEVRVVSIGNGFHLIVGNVHQWAHP